MAKEPVEKQQFILILRPLPGMAYGGPMVAEVPARIASRFLNENAAVAIDEHLFKKYRRHVLSEDFLGEVIRLAEGRGIDSKTLNALKQLKASQTSSQTIL